MSTFTKDPTPRAPFGKNAYLRSTDDVKTDSYTFAKTGIVSVTVDGVATKVLQPGTVIAKITSGADSGKVGAYDTTAADGRQTAANIIGIVDTFLPWQLNERDVEVAVVYEATVVQAWCFEYLAGVRQALSNATRDLMIAAAATKNISYK